jgi:hypothetical protein
LIEEYGVVVAPVAAEFLADALTLTFKNRARVGFGDALRLAVLAASTLRHVKRSTALPR